MKYLSSNETLHFSPSKCGLLDKCQNFDESLIGQTSLYHNYHRIITQRQYVNNDLLNK
jgi:hypothetical protein